MRASACTCTIVVAHASRSPTAHRWAVRSTGGRYPGPAVTWLGAGVRVVVCGAGVVGMCCAYELAERGQDVVVVDAGAVGAGASAGNAGWVTPYLAVPRAAPGAVAAGLRSLVSRDGPARVRPPAEPGFAAWLVGFLRASRPGPSTRATAELQALARRAPGDVDSLLERGVGFEHHADGLGVVFRDQDRLAAFDRQVDTMRSLGYDGRVSVHRGGDIASY